MFMRHISLTYVTVFLKILIWGKLSLKEKKGHFFGFFFKNFQNFENPRYQFCSPTLLILRQVI